jgi:lysyl-tRNA synthetase class 2
MWNPPTTSDKLESFKATLSELGRGDIVKCEGRVGRTKSGELTVYASNITILAPCLRPLPRAYVGILDDDVR